jgi:hypothetical protein
MTFNRLLITTLLLCPTIATAQPGGFWTGDRKKDPITDKPFSLAMTFVNNTEVNVTLRCRNGELDLFVDPDRPLFQPGEKRQVTIRFDQASPIKVHAIASEPTLLVLDHKRDADVLKPFLRAKSIAVRFEDSRARQYTFTFQSTMLPNSLTMVGRVFDDCGYADFPQAEIDEAIAEADKSIKRKPSRR